MDHTLTTLLEALDQFDESLTLSFETADGSAGPGFHVTEFKVSNVNSIDCGGTLNQWSEVGLQLMDGYGDDPMSLRKFGSIATKSMGAVEGLSSHPMYVEFSPKNEGLTRHTISSVQQSGKKVVVHLGADQAACKPMVRAESSCCGPAVVQTIEATGCCGPASTKQASCC